jgi:hypothetical protein
MWGRQAGLEKKDPGPGSRVTTGVPSGGSQTNPPFPFCAGRGILAPPLSPSERWAREAALQASGLGRRSLEAIGRGFRLPGRGRW